MTEASLIGTWEAYRGITKEGKKIGRNSKIRFDFTADGICRIKRIPFLFTANWKLDGDSVTLISTDGGTSKRLTDVAGFLVVSDPDGSQAVLRKI